MANWKTAAHLTARYAVSESRLSDYSSRGNLPLERQPDGSVLYDEDEVANLFPPRAGAFAAPAPKGPHLGLLGVMRMGDRPLEAPVATTSPTSIRTGAPGLLSSLPDRDRRRRAVRLGEIATYQGEERRRTGTHG